MTNYFHQHRLMLWVLSFTSHERVHCHNPSSGVQWTKVRNAWCQTSGPVFSSLVRAQTACLKLGSNCHGVYDARCNGRGDLHVCKTSSVSSPSSRGCVYTPTTISSTVFKPTTSAALKGAVRTYLQASPTCMSIGSFVCG